MRAGLVAAVLVFALVACGGNQPGAGGGDASEIPSLPEDPCALVTVEEVEAATGETVVRVGLIPDERLIRARVEKFDLPEIFAANPCEYVTDGTHASIVVHVDPHGGPDFEDQRERDPVNTEAIEGVGDPSVRARSGIPACSCGRWLLHRRNSARSRVAGDPRPRGTRAGSACLKHRLAARRHCNDWNGAGRTADVYPMGVAGSRTPKTGSTSPRRPRRRR
jgi:hypothetical protein